ncbi:MAG TPA: hypothetical protein VF008_11820 [Niastella sp.]
MAFDFFTLIIGILGTLVMLVPFGFAAMYLFISVSQLLVGYQEDNAFKKRGALKTIVFSLASMALLFFIWLFIMTRILAG